MSQRTLDIAFVREVFDAPETEIAFHPDKEPVKGRTLRVEISRANDAIDLKFSDLVKLTQHFGCKECNTRTWKTDGCETCDWGAVYYIELLFWKFDEATTDG